MQWTYFDHVFSKELFASETWWKWKRLHCMIVKYGANLEVPVFRRRAVCRQLLNAAVQRSFPNPRETQRHLPHTARSMNCGREQHPNCSSPSASCLLLDTDHKNLAIRFLWFRRAVGALNFRQGFEEEWSHPRSSPSKSYTWKTCE